MEILATPHGFLKAAMANNATVQAVDGGSEVSFTAGGRTVQSAGSTRRTRSSE